MIEKKRITDLIKAYDSSSGKAYDNYQGSGEPRYLSDSHRWEEIAEILRIARDAADEHNELVTLKITLNRIIGDERGEEFMSNTDLYERYRKMVAEMRALV